MNPAVPKEVPLWLYEIPKTSLLGYKDLSQILGRPESSIWRSVQTGNFPKPNTSLRKISLESPSWGRARHQKHLWKVGDILNYLRSVKDEAA